MQPFLAAIVVSIGIAVGAAYVMDSQYQRTVADAFVTQGARVSDPGANLVGTDFARPGENG